MIYNFTPWSAEKDIGKSYNRCMELLSPGDWGVFLDGDAVFTTYDWGKHITDTIEANPEYDLLTCMTNRVGLSSQIYRVSVWGENDMLKHRQWGEQCWTDYGTEVQDITGGTPLSGVMIAASYNGWKKCGGFPEGGMLGIDNAIHKTFEANGYRVGIMRGLYVYHWYRGGDKRNTKHLI